MRCCGATALVLVIASISCGADKPHALAAKEIADGWIMLFDGESTFGWKVESEARVAEGMLKIGGEKGGTLTSMSEFARGDLVWSFRQKGLNQATMTWRGEERKLSATNDWVKETYEPGTLGCSSIKLHAPPGTELEVRAVWFRPLFLEALFNGADLSGW